MPFYECNRAGETVVVYKKPLVLIVPIEDEYHYLYDEVLSLGWFDVPFEEIMIEAGLNAVNVVRGYWLKAHAGSGMDPRKAEVLRDAARRIARLFELYGVYHPDAQWKDIRLEGTHAFVLIGEQLQREYNGTFNH